MLYSPELDRLLHTLWGKAVETPDYDKREWVRFQNHLEDLKTQIRQITLIALTRPRTFD